MQGHELQGQDRLSKELHEAHDASRASTSSTSSQARPLSYYEERTFDANNTIDEDQSLLAKEPGSPGRAELGNLNSSRRYDNDDEKKKFSPLRILVITLACLVALAAVIGIVAAHVYVGAPLHTPGYQKITMDHIFNGTFAPEMRSLNWVPEAGDGVFSIQKLGHIKLVDLKTNMTTNLVDTGDIKDEHGNRLYLSNWKLSPNMKQILIKTDYRKQWRWSSFGNYYVHNIDAKTTHPIIPPSSPSQTAYATWSPTGDAIAYVTNNDLYIIPSASVNTLPIRVTTAGNASLFHGVPDWVYEEEIFSADFALWWSPDSSKLAFLVFDETAVPEFTFPIYNPTEDADKVVPYTTEVTMKYPKPGYNNPLVSVHVFDLASYLARGDENNGVIESGVGTTGFPAANGVLTMNWIGRQPVENSVIAEVVWTDNSTLLVKEVNRNADEGSVVLFELANEIVAQRSEGRVVRKLGKNGEQGDSGWIDSAQNIYPLPGNLAIAGYLDIVPTKDGYNHLALFSPADTDVPRFLTSGEWEVIDGIKGVSVKDELVYFEAATPSTDRHLYSVPLLSASFEPPIAPTAVTDTTKQSSYSSSFSPEAGFYVLSYQGPGVPWQKVLQSNSSELSYSLTMNERVLNATTLYEAATITHSTIISDGFELNVKEYRPPRMDDSGRTKYPVLFFVYGGPGSQKVDSVFKRDWSDYLSCGLQYIVVSVDGRGTGFKGRNLRNPVKNNLGYWETIDQIAAAKIWAGKNYVDPKRIGIWGWSYGGFMSAKVVEADAGVHSLAMAVAPVTSWRLYDSIYTERYMNLPAVNPGGYINASISNVTGFNHASFLLAHGSGDDNVHYANSAHLLDMFTKAKIRGFRFRMFTDSDHSINRRGANREVYEYLTAFLVEKWGKGGRRRG